MARLVSGCVTELRVCLDCLRPGLLERAVGTFVLAALLFGKPGRPTDCVTLSFSLSPDGLTRGALCTPACREAHSGIVLLSA